MTKEQVEKMGHTPGPWSVSKVGNPYSQFMIYAEGGQTNVVNTVEGEGNARLIAAAPEMLKALEQFVRYADNGSHPQLAKYMNTIAGVKMRGAIAKAKGE